MKKLVIAIVLACFALSGAAQEHLSFKGIPIEGSMVSFCQKLKDKGFTQTDREKNITFFKGDFTGRDATVAVGATYNGQDVFSVCVFFDETDSWNSLVDTYVHYKDLYTEKYGKPTLCVENNPCSIDSNTIKMNALDQGRVTYASVFEARGGEILISIEKGSLFKGFVVIKYEDSLNVKAKRQSDLDEI